MSNKKSLLGALLLGSILDSVTRERRSPLEDILGGIGGPDFDPHPPSPLHAPVELASLFISTTPLRTRDGDQIKKMAELIEQLSKLDLTKVDTLFVMALHAQEAGHKCEGCGEVHDEPSPALFGGHVGHPLTRDAMYRVITSDIPHSKLPGVGGVREGWDFNGGDNAEAEQASVRG